MNGYTDEPIHEQFEYGNYLVALHWLPQWFQFEARLYHKTGNGMIELGKFVSDSLYGARKMALNSIGGYSGIIPKDETQVG
tara:strand:+ start:1302 stop:1544 length:243 start_codon:yes stop_codon:yes gene_type:complete